MYEMFFYILFCDRASLPSEAFIYVERCGKYHSPRFRFLRPERIQPIVDLRSNRAVLPPSKWQLTVRAEPPLHHSFPHGGVGSLPQGGHRPHHGQFDIWQTRSSMVTLVGVFLVMLLVISCEPWLHGRVPNLLLYFGAASCVLYLPPAGCTVGTTALAKPMCTARSYRFSDLYQSH